MRKGRQTILDAVRAWDGRSPLPDEDRRGNKSGFSTGVLDNVRLRHFGLDPEPKTAHLYRALEDGDRETLYRLMLQHKAIEHADALAARVESSPRDCEAIAELARWILESATDREPVKYALTFLGVCGSPGDADLVMTFARNDEFTMFAVAAIERVSEDPIAAELAMAEQVHAWGKIALVERIAATGADRQDVRDWLLRRGCANAVMDEYLGYACAAAGRLHEALAAETIDAELRAGACTIVSALMIGGPAQDIKDYEHGAEAVEHLLRHLQGTTDLAELATVATIARSLAYRCSWSEDVCARIQGKARSILSTDGIEERVRRAFRSDDRKSRFQAWNVASMADVDLYEDAVALVRQEPFERYIWQWLAWTTDAKRMQRTIALAEQLLPLDRIASGPEEEMEVGVEFGEEFAPHGCLEAVLQEMRETGQFSARLVMAALRSPVFRHRLRAQEVLEDTPRAEWGAEVAEVLARAAREEPDDELKPMLRKLLKKR